MIKIAELLVQACLEDGCRFTQSTVLGSLPKSPRFSLAKARGMLAPDDLEKVYPTVWASETIKPSTHPSPNSPKPKI